jgi:hypothetical protein
MFFKQRKMNEWVNTENVINEWINKIKIFLCFLNIFNVLNKKKWMNQIVMKQWINEIEKDEWIKKWMNEY